MYRWGRGGERRNLEVAQDEARSNAIKAFRTVSGNELQREKVEYRLALRLRMAGEVAGREVLEFYSTREAGDAHG